MSLHLDSLALLFDQKILNDELTMWGSVTQMNVEFESVGCLNACVCVVKCYSIEQSLFGCTCSCITSFSKLNNLSFCNYLFYSFFSIFTCRKLFNFP